MPAVESLERRDVSPAEPIIRQFFPEDGDTRFRRLVGERQWAALPAAVRRRFSKLLASGETVLYRGEVVETQLSRAGRALSFLARLIGAPLPLTDGAVGPAIVAVTEDEALGGQSWTRLYARAGRAPQVIHSAKRFAGPTGLEEYVGYGIGMQLRASIDEGALVFRSDRYFLMAGRRRWLIPRFLAPGAMEIVHRDEGKGTFTFRLTLTHPRVGRLVHQLARFNDV